MAGPTAMGGQTFSGSGFICCSGVSNRGEVFRLLDPNAPAASTIANLVATGQEAAILRSVSDTMTLTNVSGTIISSPGALRPEVQVTSVAPSAAPPTPTPAPTPTPSAAAPSYTDCVARCIADKVPGLAAEEVLNSICGNILLALGTNPVETIAAAGPAVTAIAACTALTFGLTIGAVIECFTACAPGGRLTAGSGGNGNGNHFAFRQEAAPAPGPTQAQLARLLQLASAIAQAAAARGIQVTPAQVIQLLIQRQRAISAGQRL